MNAQKKDAVDAAIEVTRLENELMPLVESCRYYPASELSRPVEDLDPDWAETLANTIGSAVTWGGANRTLVSGDVWALKLDELHSEHGILNGPDSEEWEGLSEPERNRNLVFIRLKAKVDLLHARGVYIDMES